MKKLLFLCAALLCAFAAQAQDFPYSKYVDFTKADFEANNFKYKKKFNTWTLNKHNGWNVAVNIMALLTDGEEDMRPSSDEYSISVQMGDNEQVAYIIVEFYDDEMYHTLLTFMVDNAEDILETSSGKLLKHQAVYNNYALELNMAQHIVSRTSSHTMDKRTVKNVDESYNEYTFIIKTGIPASSKYFDKQAAKKAKRKAKGKKLDLEDMM
jgi:hypothetical protein